MDTKSFLRTAVITGLVASVFIPLIVSGYFFFPFITGKNFAFRFIVELTFALWAALLLIDRTARPGRHLMLYIVGAFIFSLGISALFAENPFKSFWSNFERMEGWIGLVHLGAYFTVLLSMLRSDRVWKIFFNFTIAVSVVVGLFGLLQLAGVFDINQGGVRVDGTLGNAIYLAVYMLFHIFFTLLALLRWAKQSIPLQIWYGFALVLQIIMIFYAATRGATVGLFVGIATTGLILLLFGRTSASFRNVGIAALIGVFLIMGGFVALKGTSLASESQALSRLTSIASPSAFMAELQTRFTIWNMAFDGFAERPVFGWGQEGFNYVFNKYYQPSLYAQEQWFDRGHNAFIDWLVAGGTVGFLLYLALFLVPAWYLTRSNALFPVSERAVLAGILVGYAVNNMSVFDNLTSYIFFMVLVAYIAFRSSESSAPVPVAPAQTSPRDSSPLFVAGASGIAIVAAVVFYFVNVPGIATASTLLNAVKAYPEGLSKNFDIFKEVAQYQGLGRQEVREQLIQFASQVMRQSSVEQDFKATVAQYAVEEMQKEIAANPNDARLHVFLGSFFRQVGAPDEARKELLQALELSPNKQTIILEIGISYHDQENLDEAAAWFKKAFDLDQRFDTARVFYAVSAIEKGDSTLAESLLMPRFGTVTPDNDFILQAYLNKKDYQSVIGVLKNKALGNPSDPQPHIQLSNVYLQIGDRKSAIAEIKNSIELDPSLKAEGEQYIQEIEAGR
ncbi:hypothetical protein A2841_00305 [Candidatus Kaiserbacteria bacterium RIFCSPHIGHO2_01_FULL_48_10]|uniref:O-antigen ligase-related domain-containing protein n=1 Tax=Candidatus Kaiserbacteria bacterium RIFCSPHIGHO2_01_FULL_48_10 TaxID=1798476 RepID=A0A1F6C1P9_9BACT|nr:MAG: hypothetical protein A2841_00305 [Candidatus Kaiserbacteria bacterium RIFCSPHIGHO2_01_FULL_48_10]